MDKKSRAAFERMDEALQRLISEAQHLICHHRGDDCFCLYMLERAVEDAGRMRDEWRREEK